MLMLLLLIVGFCFIGRVEGQSAYEMSQAVALEEFMLNNPSYFYGMVPFDNVVNPTKVDQYLQAYNTTSDRFMDLNYATNTLNNNLLQSKTGWFYHVPRAAAILNALANSTLGSSIYLNQTVADIATQAVNAYTNLYINLNDFFNVIHVFVDLNDNQNIAYICLIARRVNRLAGAPLIPIASIDAWSNRIVDIFVPRYNNKSIFVSGANMIWSSSAIIAKYITLSNETARIQGLNKTLDWVWSGCLLQPSVRDWQTKYNYGFGSIPPLSPDWAVGEHGIAYWGGYGNWYYQQILLYWKAFKSFPLYRMPDSLVKLMIDMALESFMPIIQGKIPAQWDQNYVERYGLGGTLAVGSFIDADLLNQSYRLSELQAFRAWGTFPKNVVWPDFAWPVSDYPAMNRSFKFYYSAEYAVKHFPRHSVTFRGSSINALGTEAFSYGTEPPNHYKAIFFSLGISLISRTGGEYGEFGGSGARYYWRYADMTRLPGVTTPNIDDNTLLRCWATNSSNIYQRFVLGATPFAGASSANTTGVYGWDQSRNITTIDGVKTKSSPVWIAGKRAVFFLDNAVVHLQASFNTALDSLPTMTSHDQRISVNKTVLYGNSTGSYLFNGTSLNQISSPIQWVWYDQVGYLPPNDGVQTLQDVFQGATKMFSLWTTHSSSSNLNFNWAVLPGVDNQTLATYANPTLRPWVIVANNQDVQAIVVPKTQWFGAVFRTPGVPIQALGHTISVSTAIILVMSFQQNLSVELHAASPFKKNGTAIIFVDNLNFTVKFADDPYLGETTHYVFSLVGLTLPTKKPVTVSPSVVPTTGPTMKQHRNNDDFNGWISSSSTNLIGFICAVAGLGILCVVSIVYLIRRKRSLGRLGTSKNETTRAVHAEMM